MYHLLNLAAPLLAPPAGLLRPRLGHFPLILILLCALWGYLLRLAFPLRRRALTWLVAGGSLLLLALWLPRVSSNPHIRALVTSAAYQTLLPLATVMQVTMLLSLVSAPLWVPLAALARRLREAPPPPPPAPTEASAAASAPLILTSRRAALTALAGGLPAASLLAAGYGVLYESKRLLRRELRVTIPGLPPSLRGLRIGQITDAHISPDLTPMHHLERACELLADARLDLMIATGDLCDNPRLYPDVVRLIAQIPARLGRYASLGNHELFQDPRLITRSYERSALQLLTEESVRHGALTVAGIGYPHAGSSRLDENRVPRMLDAALAERDPATFTLLLSHHPHVIEHTTGRGVGLMLSGHTHGGQVGIGERSLLEPLYHYLRGLYVRPDGARLFVSSGVGHWLPWRVNCPPEVVVIELA